MRPELVIVTGIFNYGISLAKIFSIADKADEDPPQFSFSGQTPWRVHVLDPVLCVCVCVQCMKRERKERERDRICTEGECVCVERMLTV